MKTHEILSRLPQRQLCLIPGAHVAGVELSARTAGPLTHRQLMAPFPSGRSKVRAAPGLPAPWVWMALRCAMGLRIALDRGTLQLLQGARRTFVRYPRALPTASPPHRLGLPATLLTQHPGS